MEATAQINGLDTKTQEIATRLMPYLKEVQRILLSTLVVFAAAAALGFIFYQRILTFVMSLFNLRGVTIVLTSPYQFIDLAINTALLIGVLAILPLLIYHFLTFIRPALAPKEFAILTRLLPLSLVLLVIGFAFGLWVMNFVVEIFYQTSLKFNLGNFWDISQFFSQILITALSLGIVFQFPIVLTGLLRFKIIKRKALVKSRRYIYAGCLLFAAILPPTDLLSLTLLTIPLIVLFELTLLFNQPHHLSTVLRGGDHQ